MVPAAPTAAADDTSGVPTGPGSPSEGRGRIPPPSCPHSTPRHEEPGLGPHSAGGISGEGRGGEVGMASAP